MHCLYEGRVSQGILSLMSVSSDTAASVCLSKRWVWSHPRASPVTNRPLRAERAHTASFLRDRTRTPAWTTDDARCHRRPTTATTRSDASKEKKGHQLFNPPC